MSPAATANEFNLLKTLSSLWSWIFLGILIVFFEIRSEERRVGKEC